MTETITLNATVRKKLFYNKDSMFGVYAMIPNTNKDLVKLNDHFNFTVSGNMPELVEHQSYEIEIIPTNHKKYGEGYGFVNLKNKKPESIKEQQDYVKLMISPNHYKEIIRVYPNHHILDLIINDALDYSQMRGIKKKTFLKIKDKLVSYLDIQEILIDLKELGITTSTAYKLLGHFGNATMVVQTYKNNIYDFCEVDSFGFKTIDKYAMNRGDNPENPNRIKSAIHYLLKEDAHNGHSWIHKEDLITQLIELLSVKQNIIESVLDSLKNNKKNKIFIDNNQVALEKNYNYEKRIKEILLEKMITPCKTKSVNFEEKITELEQQNGFTYTNEQKSAIRKAVQNNVFVLNGPAGTGKSLTVKGILKALNDFTYCTAALSGKAAKILSNHGLEAMTIHRMLGIDHETGGFMYNEENKLPYDILVLDETSMANIYLIYSVLIALKDDAKIIFVGDNGQLPSIGTGAVFDSLLQSQIMPQQELTIVHRQAQKSGILTVANKIREGKHINSRYDYSNQVYGELRDMVLMPVSDKTEIKDMILSICTKYKHNDLNEFQVITGMKERGDISVKNLNIELQKTFNNTQEKGIKRGHYEYHEGDKIIQNGNNYRAKVDVSEFDNVFNSNISNDFMFDYDHEDENDDSNTVEVFNGTLGTIVKIEFDLDKTRQDDKVYIKFEGIEGLVVYNKEEMKQIELAYAITVHRSQGSTIKHVLFAFDYGSYMLLSREFVYTGITRASEGCVLIAENSALHHAIENTSGDNRRVFLKDMLMEYKNK